MKLLTLVGLLTLSFSTMANLCESNASKAVETKVNVFGKKKSWHAESATCELAGNRKVNICEVSGSNGDGAGDKTFTVVLSADCKKLFAVRLTGEE